MTIRSAFVTGGTGFLGRNIVDELLERNWKVTVMCRQSSRHVFDAHPSVDTVEVGFGDTRKLADAMPENLDCIFHVAGDTSFWRINNDRQRTVNVEGTRAIVDAAQRKQVKRFVHTSTIGVYGSAFTDIDESSAHIGANSWIKYMQTKEEAEAIVREAVSQGLSATIMNPCNIVGPYDSSSWSRLFKLIDDESLPGIPPGSGIFCHARAVAKAHVNAFDNGRDGENYILGGVHASQLEFVQVASRILGKKIPDKATPALILTILGRISLWASYLTRKEPGLTPELASMISGHQSVKSNRANLELGYKNPSLDEMVQDAIDWMRKEKILAPAS